MTTQERPLEATAGPTGSGMRLDGPAGYLAGLLEDLTPMQDATDIPDLFAGLARSVVTSVHADACNISLWDHETSSLKDVAAHVLPPGRLNVVAASYPLKDFPASLWVLESGEPLGVSVSDDCACPAERAHLKKMGFSYLLMCPLMVDGEVVGLIEAYRLADRPFRNDDPKQIALLSTFAASAFAKLRMASKLDMHYMETIIALTSALEVRDPETNAHTSRIKDLAIAVADSMQVPSEVRKAVRLGAILHDVGKIGIPDSILLKPGPLDATEWEVMRQHPVIGERMLREIEFLEPALPVIRNHHERWDGEGYPDRLSGEDIPLAARIVSVCDGFDAMTSDRPYRRAMTMEAACAELLRCSGTQYDPACVALFVEVVRSWGDQDLEGRFVRYS